MNSNELHAYYRTIQHFSKVDGWATKTAMRAYYHEALGWEVPHKFRYISGLLLNGHFTPEQYKAYVLDCFINGNGNCIISETLVGKDVRSVYEDYYSEKRLELDKESFIILHKKVKGPLKITRIPGDYIKYNLARPEFPYSMLFKLLNENIVSPIFYLYLMKKAKGIRPNYESMGLVGEEETFRKLIRLHGLL